MTHTHSAQRQHFARVMAAVAPVALTSVAAMATANNIAMQINFDEPLSDQQAEGVLKEIGATLDLAGSISGKLTGAITNLEQTEDDATDVADITTIINNLVGMKVIDPMSMFLDSMMKSDLVRTLKLAVNQVDSQREELRSLRTSIQQFSKQDNHSVACLVGTIDSAYQSWAITMRHVGDLHRMMQEFDQVSVGNDSMFETPSALAMDEPSGPERQVA